MPTRGTSGLVNLGNTCYMNSTLQCLSHCIDFTIFILEQSYVDHIDMNKAETRLLMRWVTLLNEMWKEHPVLQPSSFVTELAKQPGRGGLSLRAGAQCDAHEFVVYMLDTLHTAIAVPKKLTDAETEADKTWNRQFGKEYSFLLELLYGQYSVHRAGTCSHTSVTYDPFNTVTLPIVRGRTFATTIRDCFSLFCMPEAMTDPKNLWRCETCTADVTATKTFKFWKLPPVLIVCLKRFDNMQRRINIPIEITTDTLDLSEFSETGTAQYRLVGFTNHYGSFMGGHYTAVCRNIDGLWYEFNDSSVQQLAGPGNKYNVSAYVLFYEKL